MKIFELDIFWLTIAPTYYGLMYALGFMFAYWIIAKRKQFSKVLVDDLFLYVFFGVILWGRLGYIVFYNFSSYLQDPLGILRVWEWGMSFHGWVIWVIIAVLIFAQQKKLNFWKVIDEIALTVPIGLGLGRVGNYLNGELLWFPWYTGPFAVNGRFPSPLLEAFLEWCVILLILWFVVYRSSQKSLSSEDNSWTWAMITGTWSFPWQLSALFLMLYWFFRLIVELFFRVPDPQLGYILWYLSMGAILSIVMIVVGIIIYIMQKKNNETQ